MARGRRMRHAKRRGQLTWSAALTNASTLATAVVEEDELVIGTDWAVSASQRATLLTIHGTVSLFKVSALGADIVRMFILLVDSDQPVTAAQNDPATIQNYVDEDVLWSGLWQMPVQDPIVSTGNYTSWLHLPVHVKTKRKIRGDQDVRFFIADTAGECVYSTIWRSLTKVST